MTDAIVIGAGPNGLTAAACLAQQGMGVVVLEKRDAIGGLASTYEFAPGFHASIGPDNVGLLLPEVISELSLERHGLELLAMDPVVFNPARNGEGLLIWRDRAKTVDAIRKLSSRDGDAYPQFADLVEQLAGFLRPLLSRPAPTPEIESGSDIMELLRLGWGFRQLGTRSMHELLRILPMAISDFLDEWFDNDRLKATLAAPGLESISFGPRAAGTSALFLYRQLGNGGGPLLSRKLARGGAGGVTRALAEALRAAGGTIQTETEVAKILPGKGVVTASGEVMRAALVLSSVSPRRTFLELLDAAVLPPTFRSEIDHIRYRGVTVKLNLALSELPDFTCRPGRDPAAHHRAVIQIGEDLDYLERASDAAKYGALPEGPFLQAVIPSLADPGLAPAGQHVLSVLVQYVPYDLRTDWDEAKPRLTERVLDALRGVAPNLPDAVLHHDLWTPLDYERELGLPEGSFHHGEMALDQMFFMRPVPEWARYRTPVDGLYLCGSGAHPGGDLTGAPGLNAARQVTQDRR